MTLLLLASDGMGEGDPELGKRLLRSFLERLVEAGAHVDMIGCVNRGVYLTVEGSRALDSLRVLQSRGARVRSCITCLEFYGLADNLAIGESGTMADLAQAMVAADKIVRP